MFYMGSGRVHAAAAGGATRAAVLPTARALAASAVAVAALLVASTTLHGCGGGTESPERTGHDNGPEVDRSGRISMNSNSEKCRASLHVELENYKEDLQKRCPVYLPALDDKFSVDYAAYPMCLELNEIAYHRAEVMVEEKRSKGDVSEEQAVQQTDAAVMAVFNKLHTKIKRRLGEIIEGSRDHQKNIRMLVRRVLKIDKSVPPEQLIREIDEFFHFEKNWAFFSHVVMAHCVPTYMDMCLKETKQARRDASQMVLKAMEEFKRDTPDYRESSFQA